MPLTRDQCVDFFILCVVLPLLLVCDAAMFVFECMSGAWPLSARAHGRKRRDPALEA